MAHYDIKIDHDARRVYLTITGTVKVDEVKAYFLKLKDSLEKGACYTEVLDFTHIDKFELAFKDHGYLDEMMSAVYGEQRIDRLIFTVSNDEQFGIARMFIAFYDLEQKTEIIKQ